MRNSTSLWIVVESISTFDIVSRKSCSRRGGTSAVKGDLGEKSDRTRRVTRGFDVEPGTELVDSFERSSIDAVGEGEVGREGAGDSDVGLGFGSGRTMTAGVGRFERCETMRSRSESRVADFGVSSNILDSEFDRSAQDD